MSSNLKVNSLVPATGTEIGIGTTGGSIDFRCPATFGGNVTIGGTLTYDEVINIDSIGVITARSNIDCNGSLEVAGIANFDSAVQVADKIEHLGDTNTAIRFPAADTIQFETSGHDRIYIKSDGFIGIGTDAPLNHLHLNSNGNNGVSFRMENYEGYSTFHNDGGALHFDSGFHIFRNQAGSTEFLRIHSNGKISTGVSNNSYELTIGGLSGGPTLWLRDSTTSGSPRILFGSTSAALIGGITYNNSSNHMEFATNGGEKVRIDSSGRMIIGTVKNVNSSVHYDDLTINNSNQSGNQGSTGIDLVSSDDAYGAIIFSDNSAYEQGYIKYVHNSNYDFMKFGTNSNDRWQLSKDGHWLPLTNNFYDIGSNSSKVRNVSIAGTMTSGRATITGTTIAVRNSGVSTATGSIIYNSNLNSLEFYNGSEWKAISYKASSFNVNYLVVGGGGGGGGYYRGGGGGAGALRTNMSGNAQGGGQSTAPAKSISIGIAYSIILGAGGAGAYNSAGNAGGTTTFDDIVSNGGTGGGRYERDAPTNSGNGSGGGGGGHTGTTRSGGAGGTYGYNGGNGSNSGATQCGGGGGGAAAQGQSGGGGGTDGDGGAALTNTITGSTVAYAGGAGGGNYGGGNQTIGGGAGAAAGAVGSSGAPGIDASIPNRGSGGGGAGGSNVSGGTGSAGVIILRFPTTYTATVTGGVTSSSTTVGTDTVLTITATSDSSQTVTFA